MSKTDRAWAMEQVWLLPPAGQDFVPAGHPAHLVRELVGTELDLATIVAAYEREARGRPRYHPVMMVALLLYACTQGSYAARKIAKACEERLDVIAVTGLQRPDFRTISEFRRRHLAALRALFAQVLRLCRQAGLVKLGHVANTLRVSKGSHKRITAPRPRQLNHTADLEQTLVSNILEELLGPAQPTMNAASVGLMDC